jgi:short-subunit dehydrogenase
MIAAGGGRVVTVSSAFGLMATPYYSAYSSSKFAIRGFSDSLRQELALADQPVAVTCVYPGGVRTPIVRNGMFGRGQDTARIIRDFEENIARTDPPQAATAILRGVERGRDTVLVGADARLVAAFVWAAGLTYPGLLTRLIPWVLRLRAIRWRPHLRDGDRHG